MDSLFFGSSEHPVFGAYHSADFSRDRGEGVVLCYPFGQEYMRAHRAFRQLASGLSKLGYHVLRFDYRGTGDSYGDLEEISPKQWLEDIDSAIEELTDISGVRKVSLLGLRVGGFLAQHYAYSNSKISRLVLWDPVVSGQSYIDEIKREIDTSGENLSQANFIDSEGNLHINGFALSQGFQDDLREITVDYSQAAPQKILLAVSHESPEFIELKKSLSDTAKKFTYLFEAAPHDWNYVDHVGGILLPSNLLNKILEWFK